MQFLATFPQPKSPDANCAWGILKSKVGTKKYQSVDYLKKELRRQWGEMPQSHFRGACDVIIGRLKATIHVKGDQFEVILKFGFIFDIFTFTQ